MDGSLSFTRGVGLALLTFALHGCRASSTAPPTNVGADAPSPATAATAPSKAAAPPLRFAVIGGGTVLYPGPDADVGVLTRSRSARNAQGSVSGKHIGWVVAVVEEQETRVRVRTLPGADPGANCGQGFEGLEAFELEPWVARESLRLVTTRTADLRFDDGSGLMLPPGLPVFDEAPPRPDSGSGVFTIGDSDPVPFLQLNAWGFNSDLGHATNIEAFQASLGHIFELAERPELGASNDPVPEHTALVLGGQLVVWPDANEPASAATPVSVRTVDDTTFLTFRGRCLDADLIATSKGVIGMGRLGRGRPQREYKDTPPSIEIRVPAGATIRWSDGSAAGRTREAVTLERPQAPGDGHCVYVGVGNEDSDLALCFDPAEVQTNGPA